MDIVDWVKKQTGKIADNVKDYKFYVKHSPELIDSSTTLTLTAYNSRDETSTVPCIYKWSRIKNGLIIQVPEFKGNSFICEPSDIGSIIQAEITSTDGAHPGTAILKYGPVKFDVIIKRQIEHSLSSGSALINVDLTQKNEVRECQLRITEDNIKIAHCNTNVHYIFDYTMSEPRIEASLRDPLKVNISFSERYETEVKRFIQSLFGSEELTESVRLANQHRLQLRFSNRNLKDNFLYILKAFNTKRAMKNASVMSKIENIDLNKDDNFNYMMEIESLRNDLVKLGRINDKYLADKRMYYNEARRYEKEIEEIIITYTKIADNKFKSVGELDQSVMELHDRKDEAMERKLNNLMRENDTLKDRIEFLSEELRVRGGGSQLMDPSLRRLDSDEQPRGGFIKKRQVEEVSAGNHFNTILEKLDESEVRESTPSDEQVKSLTQEKIYLAKKLNDSVRKVAKLEEKITKLKLNQSAMNPDLNRSNLSLEDNQRCNITEMDMGRQNMTTMKQETDFMRSKIPVISSHEELQSEQNAGLRVSNVSVKSKSSHALNPQVSGDQSVELQKKYQQLVAENEQLKDQIQMLKIEKEVILKEKTGVELKYKKKLSELVSENSMYRKNQDALNRSQNLSMEMDVYNEEQNALLKEQNDFLVAENEKLTRLVEKYMSEAKQVPKLQEEISKLSSKLRELERRNTEFSISKSEDEILLHD